MTISKPLFLHVKLTPVLRMFAPLAQLVERFHGKEEVNGSIPLGGSKITLGGVAQLGRACGS